MSANKAKNLLNKFELVPFGSEVSFFRCPHHGSDVRAFGSDRRRLHGDYLSASEKMLKILVEHFDGRKKSREARVK